MKDQGKTAGNKIAEEGKAFGERTEKEGEMSANKVKGEGKKGAGAMANEMVGDQGTQIVDTVEFPANAMQTVGTSLKSDMKEQGLKEMKNVQKHGDTI